jgi:hypothetical protein
MAKEGEKVAEKGKKRKNLTCFLLARAKVFCFLVGFCGALLSLSFIGLPKRCFGMVDVF